MSPNDPALLVFVRNPVAGKVKTRIAAEVGNEKALAIYLELLALTRNLALDFQASRYLYYSEAVELGDAWPEEPFCKRVQRGNTLGERMYHAFCEVLENHAAALLIGSDCPAIRPSDLYDACAALSDADLVLGPAADGGYYLIGMKTPHACAFEGIPWGSSRVLDQTLAALDKAGLQWHLLRKLRDVDTFEDWLGV
ncbi:MAG: TIGR04282 family arsenosugar biosynthesis glycosyltransferase [Saprospiraceae bacterium]|nr:TIGR04282 family arsenosugar biosynthesis glycosyltransferase [Saprospiraceae bacterium]